MEFKKLKLLLVLGLIFASACAPLRYEEPFLPQKPIVYEQFSGTAPKNFTEAKKWAWKIFSFHRNSFYCDCSFTPLGAVLSETCTYKPANVNQRSYRIEWEHIMPAQTFGKTRPCWNRKLCVDQIGNSYKGRACCAKIDQIFQRMEADLHNLVPAIGSINQARGTLYFGEVKEPFEYIMGCPIKINRKEKMVEPRDEIKGTVARAYLYMSEKYNVPLSLEQQKLYQAWHKGFAPLEWEIRWNRLVKVIQGNSNHYIENNN